MTRASWGCAVPQEKSRSLNHVRQPSHGAMSEPLCFESTRVAQVSAPPRSGTALGLHFSGSPCWLSSSAVLAGPVKSRTQTTLGTGNYCGLPGIPSTGPKRPAGCSAREPWSPPELSEGPGPCGGGGRFPRPRGPDAGSRRVPSPCRRRAAGRTSTARRPLLVSSKSQSGGPS